MVEGACHGRLAVVPDFGWRNADAWRGGPHAIEVVMSPSVLVEDVYDDVSVVEDDPAGAPFAADERQAALVSKIVLDGVGDRARLTVAVGRRDDQVVGVRTPSFDTDDCDVLTFFVLRYLGHFKGLRLGFDNDDLVPSCRSDALVPPGRSLRRYALDPKLGPT